jgi:hydroxymethylbilane synthase
MKVIVGSRGSNLAITQTNWVLSSLREKCPELEFEIKIIKTKGDKILDKALDKIGDKGLFVTEIENELINGDIDLAVHSMKDMPSEQPDGLMFAGVPKREDPRDVLVLREGINSLDEVPIGGKIATGSKRRKYQLLKLRPDLEIMPIRGNVETRIRKIKDENLDGTILAAAGIKRIGLEHKISQYFEADEMIPAPAQGVLAIEVKSDRLDLIELLSLIKDRETQIQVDAERSFLEGVDGSCHMPIGAFGKIDGDLLILSAVLGREDGSHLVRKTLSGHVDDAKYIGHRLAEMVYSEVNSDDK